MKNSKKPEKRQLKSMKKEKTSDLLQLEVQFCISVLSKWHMSIGCITPHCNNSLICLIMVLISLQNLISSKIEYTTSHNALPTKYTGISIEDSLREIRPHLSSWWVPRSWLKMASSISQMLVYSLKWVLELMIQTRSSHGWIRPSG